MECCGIECRSTLRAAGNLTLIPCLHKHNWLINLILIRQTPPLWLFKVCKTNAAEKKERKKAFAQIDPVWLCTCSFCSVSGNEKKKKFPVVICILLYPQSADAPWAQHTLAIHLQANTQGCGKQTHQLAGPGLHSRFHISIPIGWRSESQSRGRQLQPAPQENHHLEDKTRL